MQKTLKSFVEFALTLSALIFLFTVFNTTNANVNSQDPNLPEGGGSGSGTIGSITFAPTTVKNSGTFTISVKNAPPNVATTIFVDNGSGYENFGDWISTDSRGSIYAIRTLNCSSYNTLTPGQLVPVGNRVLTQKVYLTYSNGARSAEASHTKDCTNGSIIPAPPTGDTTNTGTNNRRRAVDPSAPVFPSGENNKIQFVKKAVDLMPLSIPGWINGVGSLVAIKNRFVMASYICTTGSSLWVISENGSVTSRSSCEDSVGFRPSNKRVAAQIGLDWADSTKFVHGMAGSDELQSAVRANGPADESIDHAMYYDISGAQAELISVSPNGVVPQLNREIKTFGGKVAIKGRVYSLPNWSPLGTSLGVGERLDEYISFGNLLIELPRYGSNDANVYKISNFGTKNLVKTIQISKNENSYFPAYDNSTWPPKIGFLEYEYTTQVTNAKISVFKLTPSLDDIVLDKIITLPQDFPTPVNSLRMALWGNYVVIRNTSLAGYPIELWKGSERIDRLQMFELGSYVPELLTVSQNGYLAVAGRSDSGLFIYRLDVESQAVATPVVTPPVGTSTPPTFTPPASPTYGNTGNCEVDFKTSKSLIGLCKQVQVIQNRSCQIVPGLPFCSGGGGADDTGSGPQAF